MQVGEIGLKSRAIQAAGADIGRARRVGGDRHERNPELRGDGPSPFLTVWSIVRAACGVCQAQQFPSTAGPAKPPERLGGAIVRE
jgi:hypothetical protein